MRSHSSNFPFAPHQFLCTHFVCVLCVHATMERNENHANRYEIQYQKNTVVKLLQPPVRCGAPFPLIGMCETVEMLCRRSSRSSIQILFSFMRHAHKAYDHFAHSLIHFRSMSHFHRNVISITIEE